MALSYNPWTGHPSSIISSLNRSLGQYQRDKKYFKIGLTTEPEERWSYHKHHGWAEMVVIHKTSSSKYAAEIEDLMIRRGWEIAYDAQCTNERGGGGGLKTESDYYCVYVVSS